MTESRQSASEAKAAKAEYRRDLPHIQRSGKTYFVTFTTHKRWILPDSVRSLVIEHSVHDHGTKAWIHGLVVMPDHVHMVMTPLEDASGNSYGLAEILSGIKGASAHSINGKLGRKGRVWQHESFDHILRSDESAEAKADYICSNPVRKGLVREMNEYRWLWRVSVDGVGKQSAEASAAGTTGGGCAT